jgi:hypothetical protein
MPDTQHEKEQVNTLSEWVKNVRSLIKLELKINSMGQ